MKVDTAEEANQAAMLENPPPGHSMADEQTAVKKGDVIAHFNHWNGIWEVKRVVKAGKPTRSGYGGNAVYQTDVNYVSHDAVPEDGKTGVSRNHYPSGSGFGIGGSRSFSKDGAFPWFWVDMDDPRAAAWVAEQDQLWADYNDDLVAEEERVNGTPEAFQERMATRANQADFMAEQAEGLAKKFRAMAEEIRTETRGRWVK